MDVFAFPRVPLQLMFGALLCLHPAESQTDGPERARQIIAEGVRFIQEDRLSEAADWFRKAMIADPNNADAPHDLGVVLRRQKNFADAVTAFKSALRLRPEEARIHNNLALALEDLGRISEAVAAMKMANALQPDNVTIKRNLGVMDCKLGEEMRQNGEVTGALPAFREAEQLASDMFEPHQLLGSALLENGNLEEAEPELRRALKIQPSSGEAIEIWEFFYRGETGLRKLPLNCVAQPNWFPGMLPFITI